MATVFSFLNNGETYKNYNRMFPFDSVRTLGYKYDIAWRIAAMIPGIDSNYEYLEVLYNDVLRNWSISASEVVKSIFDILVLRGDLIGETALWLHEHQSILVSDQSFRL